MEARLAVARGPTLECRLRRREPRDRHAVGRRRDIRKADLVTEGDRRGVAAVLAADSDLEIFARLAPAFDGDAHHGADALAVEHLEGIGRDDLFLDVARKEALLRVVARDAEDRLGEVVRAEAEELSLRRDLVRDEAGARDLDHRPELEHDALAALV